MVEPGWLAGGLIIGLAFAAMMVFKILPAADQVVKKQYGPCEAYLTTRFCCLCIALPFYVFTIWMILVVTFHSDKGVELIQQMCPDDYLCSNSFAMGRTNHDLEACTSPDCGLDNYLARSGSQPLKFPRLGLGKDMELNNETRTYSCEKVSVSEDFPLAICSEIKDVKNKQVCECVDLNFELGICEKYTGCDDDISKSLHITTCEKRFTTEESICTIWNVKIDSAKQFGFRDCLCNSFGDVNGNQVCDQWTCDELTMDYYYPNVFFAGAVTILFIFPLMAIMYYTAKTQLRKVCKCGEFQMYVYSQEAGIQSETVAENLATGGFTNTQQGKTKYRTFSRKDVVLLLLSPLAMLFFGWLVVESAGRVGLAFIGLAGGLIAARELYKYTKFLSGRKDRLDERIEKNNPSPTYF